MIEHRWLVKKLYDAENNIITIPPDMILQTRDTQAHTYYNADGERIVTSTEWKDVPTVYE